jgi:heptosyltransferase-3
LAEGAPLEAPRSILVVNVCRIGDTLLATPALRALAKAYPGAAITALGHPKRVEVLEHLPWLARTGGISKASARLRARFGAPEYDLALVYGFDAPLVEYALRAAERVVAFRQRDDALNRRLYRAVEPPLDRAGHAVHLALQLTDALGVPHASYRLGYQVTAQESAWAEQQLAAATSGIRVGLQLASFPTKAYRDWPEEHFIALAGRMRERWPEVHFMIFGGDEDRARAARVAERIGPCTVFAGKLSLRQTAALMSRLKLYVGVDTGPTHIMGCFDIPLVALYHCYSPSRLIGALDHPLFFPVDHPRPYPCTVETPMAELPVERVLEAVSRALA